MCFLFLRTYNKHKKLQDCFWKVVLYNTYIDLTSTFWPLWAAGEARPAAMEWRWREEVPDNLRPYQSQWVRAASVETWDGWDFIMLDYWNRTTCRWICRYAAAPTYTWNVNSQGKGSWHADFPRPGLLLLVRESKWRGRQKGNLLWLLRGLLRADADRGTHAVRGFSQVS